MTKSKELYGAVARWLPCREHGEYYGSILIVGRWAHLSVCPACRRLIEGERNGKGKAA